MATYPYTVARDRGTYLIRFPDVPEALTSVDSEEEICAQALDCLATALAGHAIQGRPWPEPRKSGRGARMLTVPALVTAKLELLLAMRRAKMSNSALAKRLGIDEKSVRRLLDLNHRSHIDQLEAALQKLGKRVEVRVEAA
jgi:antitoxin HicB